MMYYLVESTGQYEDRTETALEFSEDLNDLENKANQYNKAVEKAQNLCNNEGNRYYLRYSVLLNLEVANLNCHNYNLFPTTKPITKEEHVKECGQPSIKNWI